MSEEGTVRKQTPGATRALAIIAVGQLLALSLWFSASAVSPQLVEEWRLTEGEEAGLTLAIQLGFVVGALLLAGTSVADAVPSRRLFVVSALGGAASNAALLWVTSDSVGIGLGLRLLTGAFLAGLYPAGLKVMSGWFKAGRGMALGVLVGALTVGSAAPHLLRGLGLEWRGVIGGASVLTLVAALLMTRVEDGPYEVPTQPFRLDLVPRVVRNRGVRLSTFGYLGHMWELYAMWTWLATFLIASSSEANTAYPSPSVATFSVIAVGGLGSWLAGVAADRLGRTRVAGGAMVISGSCALITPLLFGRPFLLVMPVLMVWGFTVVADSAQFSAMVTETADDATRGTALTLQTAVGFLLTLVTIRGVPLIAGSLGWQWAFPVLAIGPGVGALAMIVLARSPEANRLAGGRG